MSNSDSSDSVKQAEVNFHSFMSMVHQLDIKFSGQLEDWNQQMLLVYDEVIAHPYIKDLKRNSKVDAAIAKMEKRFRQLTQGESDDSVEMDVNRKAREVRLLICMARLIQSKFSELKYLNPSALSKSRKSVSKACMRLSQMIALHMEDPYFAGRPGESPGRDLDRAMNTLDRLVHIFNEAKPQYPYQKTSGYPWLHHTVEQLARSCFRIYSDCKASYIKDLLSVEWVQRHVHASISDEDIRRWIKSAHTGKQQDYLRRRDEQEQWCQTHPELWSDSPNSLAESPFQQ